MDPFQDSPDARAIHAFASGCQVLAGVLCGRDTPDVIARLEQLAASVPRAQSLPGHLAASSIVAGLCHQVSRTYDMPLASVAPVTPNCAPHDLSRALRSLVVRLLVHRLPTVARPDERVLHLCNVMQRSVERPRTIAELARHVGLSASRAQHLFSAQMGISIGRYFKELRLQRAAEMLRNPAARVSDAAYGSGFAGLAQFDRAFRRRFGTSPRAYRTPSGSANQ